MNTDWLQLAMGSIHAAQTARQRADWLDDSVRARESAACIAHIDRARTQMANAEREIVAELRAAGASWADVATVLGMTRQAAHQRFS